LAKLLSFGGIFTANPEEFADILKRRIEEKRDEKIPR